ncbi:MAG: hypothetical protein HY819_12790 [Acidobacteria bacterium]|nr:hypothetical protein [Acidobacteriota bacterium]
MLYKALIIALIIFIVFYGGNIEQKTQTPQTFILTENKNSNVITSTNELEKDKAMLLVFGNYNNIKDISEWVITKQDINKHKIPEDWLLTEEKTILYVKPIVVESFKEGNTDKKLIITKAHPNEKFDDCHACGVIIGGILFSKINGEWKLDIDQRYITLDGEFGDIDFNYELAKIGNNRYGIIMFPLYSGLGIDNEKLFLITVVNNELRKVLEADKSGNNEGVGHGKLWRYDSKYKFIPQQRSEYYNFSLNTSGTMYSNNKSKIIKVNKNKIYSFKNGVYIKAK